MTARRRQWEPVVAIVAVALVFAALVALSVSRRWWPVSDDALIVSGVHDVGRATPLVGVFSRFGWRHPGPWLFWLFAPAYRVGGTSPNGVLVGAVLVNLVSVAGVARIAWRRGGRSLLLLALVALVVMMRSVGAAGLIDPWNPSVPLLPFAWCLFLAWDVACGHRWSLPVLIGVGSYALQCHVGYAVPIIAVSTWAFAAFVIWSRRRETVAAWRVAAVGVVVSIALWVGPVIAQFQQDPGNMRALWDFFAGGGSDQARSFSGGPALPVGATRAAGMLAREVVGVPWMGASEPFLFFNVVPLSPWLLSLPVIVLIGLLAVAMRAHAREQSLALGTAIVTVAATWLAFARIAGEAPNWIVRFSWSASLFVWVVVVWAGWSIARKAGGVARSSLIGPVARVAAAAVVAVLVVQAIGIVGQARHARLPGEEYGPSVAALGDPVDSWLRAHHLTSVTVASTGQGFGSVDSGVALELQRRGYEMRIVGLFAGGWPTSHQVSDAGSAPAGSATALVVVTGQDAIEQARLVPGTAELAVYVPTTEAERVGGALPVAVFAPAD